MMAAFSSLWLTLLPVCFFLIIVQTSVISDHFKSRVLDEQLIGQSVNLSLETEDDMMTQLNGGALADFFHSYSVLEEDDKSDVFKEPKGDETSDLIYVQDFLNLTDHDLPSSRSISPKFKGNAGNPQIEEDVTEGAEDLDQFHEHPSIDFVSDVLKNKMNETTEASSEVLASSPPESKVMEESSQPGESSPMSESSVLVTPPVLSPSSPPSSTPTLPPTLEYSSTSDSAPPPVFSPPAVSLPSPVGQPVSEFSTQESSSTVSSSPPAMDGVDDSLDTLFMELENLNNLNQAVKALNQGPFDDKKQAEDRTDVIADGYGNDEADDIFSDLFNWFG